MIKKMFGSAAFWIIGWLFLSAWTIYTSSLFGVAITVIWFILPLLTFMLNLAVRKHITAWVTVPATMGKQKKIHGELVLKNDSILPVSRVLCKIKITNCLTKEVNTAVIRLSAAALEDTTVKFELSSNHCGYLIAEVSKCCLLDWFGFLPLSCTVGTAGKISVLPDTFVPGIVLSLSATARDDSQSWSQTQKGNDMTEVFALRDYVPGDSLKQIHWKLSSKKQQLIVREPSLPVEKSLLIFWDKNTEISNGKEMDAMAECMVSVCQEILNQGITFTVGWTEEKLCVFENIDTDDQLLAVIPRMLKHGADTSSGSGAFLNAQAGGYGSYGKVIYLAGSYPDDLEPFSEGELSLLLCKKEKFAAEYTAVFFDAEHYEEDLEMIEL